MDEKNDIDHILQSWPFDPTSIVVRQVAVNERTVLQLRLDMGLLQLETTGRPDGKRPHGEPTYFAYLQKTQAQVGDEFELSEDQCAEVDREFVQFYHRRVCWLHLQEFEKAVADADHTLQLMNFCRLYSPDDDWTVSHEQYRPFVLYHRTQAAALAYLKWEEPKAAEMAIEEVQTGLAAIRQVFDEYEAEAQFDSDELVVQLREFEKSLRDRFQVGKTLTEKLSEAIAEENYELAAQLRDQLNSRQMRR